MIKENLTKFYESYKLYIFPVVVILASLFLIIFVILPQTIKLIENQKTTGDLNNRSKFLENKVLALEGYNQKDLSQKLQLTLSSFPQDRDFGNVLGLLQGLITQSGFSISSIALGNTSHKFGNSDSYEVKLEIKGPRILFRNLLNALESSQRLIRLSTIEISSNQTDQTLDISLALEVLYSDLPQSLGTVDSPLPELSQKDQQLLDSLAKTGGKFVSTFSAIPLSPLGKSNPFD